ncbi:hypothetical protein 16Q_074c [Pseudomonas phage 16Q]|nr:hypothetical protein 16Q_074c [Pseudomonas phage 16Q]
MSQKILKLTDCCDDFTTFEVEENLLYVVVNDSTSVELTEEDVTKLKNFLEEVFPSPKTQAPADLGCMQSVGEDLVMDSRKLPANITLNVTGNVTINN